MDFEAEFRSQLTLALVTLSGRELDPETLKRATEKMGDVLKILKNEVMEKTAT